MNAAPNPLPTPDQLRDVLRVVVDPEVGVNIVDLGLVYNVAVSPAAVKVDLTMTSPACPLSDLVIADAEAALHAALPETCAVSIDLVWNPPWDPRMMSDKARENLGW
ncbi:metal-sulfur cluster assembly factor [Dechloromonas denitrificans]|uniref:metal-sulfur cluster assembly factor n=1 Tax=Dechloromonas denitrificans TaxID=281362 RepID=UPI001CF9622A|nr:metal-sulfur cluster assembly factor [Dechloromonas denitrificans]UCV09019.1 metal-sulfur cluster assembly factor [Dechloromonas denitrificans]